jgi:hypothetical protein
MSLDLLTSHSGFQFGHVLSEDGLVAAFALRCLMPISNALHEPQANGNYRCGCNDHRHLQSLSTHSLIIALAEPLKLPNWRKQAISRFDRWSLSDIAMLRQLMLKPSKLGVKSLL